jgi:hypothetical protein
VEIFREENSAHEWREMKDFRMMRLGEYINQWEDCQTGLKDGDVAHRPIFLFLQTAANRYMHPFFKDGCVSLRSAGVHLQENWSSLKSARER